MSQEQQEFNIVIKTIIFENNCGFIYWSRQFYFKQLFWSEKNWVTKVSVKQENITIILCQRTPPQKFNN